MANRSILDADIQQNMLIGNSFIADALSKAYTYLRLSV